MDFRHHQDFEERRSMTMRRLRLALCKDDNKPARTLRMRLVRIGSK